MMNYFKRILKLPKGYIQPFPGEKDRIVVAMSSGVDSSVTAALCRKIFPRSEVEGIFMANWTSDSNCTDSDWNDVKKTCSHIGIPCRRVDFEKEYWTEVFEPMLEQYRIGKTPNPDVGCNRYVKFGKMIEHLTNTLGEQQPWWLVTGHYARVLEDITSREKHLLRSDYLPKDQSYYLSRVKDSSLERMFLPIGHFSKPEIRNLAKKWKLPTSSKPDSQGLCFVSQKEGHFKKFLDEFLPPEPGDIITIDENGFKHKWGSHQGLWHATIGQRSGVSMPQGDRNYKGAWFVSEKRPKTNEIVIVKGSNNPALYKDTVETSNWLWLGPFNADNLKNISINELIVQYRSLQDPIGLLNWKFFSQSINNQRMTFRLKQKYRAISPGQIAVLYHRDRVLGCGMIT
ncbi:tRNA-specific 2-thiouridylase, mitochondrial [Komagataella phaffii]|uniref:tRNA-5-taurinomethyluridine 2-sulfurtransferase n=2 Tax=Komagataella phaffii TaxID=460519 RepID=C4QX90_KOMPG|nr:tRNA-specific 2-thiouridylase, responsible for 2-thiolation of the wobble base of mitochondrial tRNA [Komagataella phaffii GS115]AOA61140.1 GQ67_02159T0 [Komagataella phaffii]AOA66198.1 GQ68_02174T0 [Komagataella phaffii GS115]CAY67863.1 tRNA-specific 2-thiouridylase, responsible for 2-thiolation of the wobble base of mitochondrial tRNA [Komagataella phaffii GS115]